MVSVQTEKISCSDLFFLTVNDEYQIKKKVTFLHSIQFYMKGNWILDFNDFESDQKVNLWIHEWFWQAKNIIS